MHDDAEENDTGGWCMPSMESLLQLPEIKIQRGGILYPMPQLHALIVPTPKKRWYWRPKTVWQVQIRQFGQDRVVNLGPFETFEDAKRVHQDMYAWYVAVYNVIIRTYKATERNRT